MNSAFDEVLRADTPTRTGLYTATAQRLGTTPQNVEKDFWVCWTLDALFNGIEDGPRLLFKGGTSLSKGFGLIERFSEDIDVTVFRNDLGVPATIAELAALSRKKRDAALDAIKDACEAHINGPMKERLAQICADTCTRTGLEPQSIRVEADAQDGQTLLLIYPSITPEDAYIAKSVKIESGAKSALDPNSVRTIVPYVDADAVDLNLAVSGITVVDAERTFWDKVVTVAFIDRHDGSPAHGGLARPGLFECGAARFIGAGSGLRRPSRLCADGRNDLAGIKLAKDRITQRIGADYLSSWGQGACLFRAFGAGLRLFDQRCGGLAGGHFRALVIDLKAVSAACLLLCRRMIGKGEDHDGKRADADEACHLAGLATDPHASSRIESAAVKVGPGAVGLGECGFAHRRCLDCGACCHVHFPSMVRMTASDAVPDRVSGP